MESDLGVRRSTGEPLIRVRKRFFGPKVGQYTFDGSTWTFSRRDQGRVMVTFVANGIVFNSIEVALQKTWLRNRNIFEYSKLLEKERYVINVPHGSRRDA
jgi:hypothetical protein